MPSGAACATGRCLLSSSGLRSCVRGSGAALSRCGVTGDGRDGQDPRRRKDPEPSRVFPVRESQWSGVFRNQPFTGGWSFVVTLGPCRVTGPRQVLRVWSVVGSAMTVMESRVSLLLSWSTDGFSVLVVPRLVGGGSWTSVLPGPRGWSAGLRRTRRGDGVESLRRGREDRCPLVAVDLGRGTDFFGCVPLFGVHPVFGRMSVCVLSFDLCEHSWVLKSRRRGKPEGLVAS